MLNLMRLKQVVGTLNEQDLNELNTFMDSGNPVQRVVSMRSVADQLN